jgi:hypothetical protein
LREQGFPWTLLRDLAGMRENVLETAVGVDQFLCRLLTDPTDAGNIVGAVADEGEVVGHERGWDTESFAAIFDADPLLLDGSGAAPARIQQPDAGTNELLEVLIPRDDNDVETLRGALPRERADDVVSLVAGTRNDRNPLGVEERAEALHPTIEVRLELLRELLSGRLVAGVSLVTERETGIVYPAQVFRLVRGQEPIEKVDNSPGGGGVLTVAGRERPRDERKERAIDERVAVHQEQSRRWRRSDDGRFECRRSGHGTAEMQGTDAATVGCAVGA